MVLLVQSLKAESKLMRRLFGLTRSTEATENRLRSEIEGHDDVQKNFHGKTECARTYAGLQYAARMSTYLLSNITCTSEFKLRCVIPELCEARALRGQRCSRAQIITREISTFGYDTWNAD